MASDGVRLRPLDPTDAEVMAAWGDDLLFCDEAGWSRELDPAERRVRWGELIAQPPPALLRLAAVTPAGDIVGYVDLFGDEPGRRELGFLVGGRERWGQGWGTRLGRAGLAYGFDVLGLDTIWAEAAATNIASVRILQRIGMTGTGRGSNTVHRDLPTFHRTFEVARPTP